MSPVRSAIPAFLDNRGRLDYSASCLRMETGMISTLSVRTKGQGLYEITERVAGVVRDSNVIEGVCTLFVQHTSASLIIQENADPSARFDLQAWMSKLVPEDDQSYTHTAEGDDDMPAHIRSAITPVSLSIPVADGKLMLGMWQGIFLWEHRYTGHTRSVVVRVG